MAKMHPCRPVDLTYFDTARTQFSNAVDLTITPQELFDYLARADTWPQWVGVITHVDYTTPEPHGVGTTRIVTMRAGIVGDEEFLVWEPGKRLAFRFNEASVKALTAFIEDYVIEETPTGSRLTWRLAQELGGAARFTAPLTSGITNIGFKRFLRKLQKLTADGVPVPR